jgi:GT2 family glycosyltransferase
MGNKAFNSTAIIIVNWNGWSDTIECLEAVFRLQGFAGPVIVCDNGSSDGSTEKIRAWADGNICALPESGDREIGEMVSPPVNKPIPAIVFRPDELQIAKCAHEAGRRLWIVEIGENLGFAAGNNVGLRLLNLFEDIQWFWLLNNDTVPSFNAYAAFEFILGQVHEPVICGSVLLEYWNTGTIQACGAFFNRYSGMVKHNCEGFRLGHLKSLPDKIPVSYPVGASLLINRAFILKNGFMSEDYFLYYEEIDWVLRDGLPGRAFVVRDSHVYHKGCKSTDAGRIPRNRGLTADYYVIRGRILLLRKYIQFNHPGILLTVVSSLRRLVRPTSGAFSNAISAVIAGLRWKD